MMNPQKKKKRMLYDNDIMMSINIMSLSTLFECTVIWKQKGLNFRRNVFPGSF